MHSPAERTEPEGLTRSALASAGLSDHDIRKAVRARELVAICHGLYLWRTDFDALGPAGHHRIRARRVGLALRRHEVLSHVSAAVLHGLDVPEAALERVHVSRFSSHNGRVSTGLHVHPTAWDDDEVTEVRGVAVTSVARTVVDLARTLTREQAVVAGDSALRRHPDARAQLPRVLEESQHRHGMVPAVAALRMLDGRSANAVESLSRVRMHAAGIPAPTVGHELCVPGGQRHRVAFLWPAHAVVGECDDGAAAAGPAAHRHDETLRGLGYEVVRWTAGDLADLEGLRRRLHRVCRGTATAGRFAPVR